jgi:2'-5' RNA ligase
MSELVRAFVALELPEPVRDALVATMGPVRGRAPGKLAWTPRDNLHLTLAFLGGSEPERLEALGEALRELGSRHAPFALELGGPGMFPNARMPSVLWVGTRQSPALTGLQAHVAEACRKLGWALESRPFAAHLTCARVKHAAAGLAELWGAARVVPARWNAGALSLMRSDTRPSGAAYAALARFPLGQ